MRRRTTTWSSQVSCSIKCMVATSGAVSPMGQRHVFIFAHDRAAWRQVKHHLCSAILSPS
jgi:hypothetical protein